MDLGGLMARCSFCDKRKGKRVCSRNDNLVVCSECCGSERNWCECDITCTYFPKSDSPSLLFKGAMLLEHGTGDQIHLADYLYIPNLYEYVHCNVNSLEFKYINSNSIEITGSFKLKNLSSTNKSDFNAKEEFKSELFPTNKLNNPLFPVLMCFPGPKGICRLDEMIIESEQEWDVAFNKWIIIPPFSRPHLPNAKHIDKANYIFGKNISVFAELDFNREYKFRINIMNVIQVIHFENKDIMTKLGILFPFGTVCYENIKVYSPPEYSHTSLSADLLSPIESENYPGENSKQGIIEMSPLRGNEKFISAKGSGYDIRFLENGSIAEKKISEYFSAFFLFSVIKSASEMDISIVKNNKVINPVLTNVFINNIGNNLAPLHLNIVNFSTDQKRIKIQTKIQGTAIEFEEYVNINASSDVLLNLTLPGLNNLEMKGDVPFKIAIFNSGTIIFEDSITIHLLAKDVALLQVLDTSADWYRDTTDCLACWVNPRAEGVDEIVSNSRKYHPDRTIVGGGQFASTLPQVKAIWDYLSYDMKLTYVNRAYAIGSSNKVFIQRVTTVNDTIRLQSGNCIDLTVLFASILENINISPEIILIPGHAFFAWSDHSTSETFFLETTMLGVSSFEDAVKRGFDLYNTEYDSSNHQCKKIDVFKVRPKGFIPIH